MRKLIGMGKLKNNLYYFKSQALVSTFLSNKNQTLLLHQRLGHVSFSRLSFISELQLFNFNKLDDYCDAFHQAKQIESHFMLVLLNLKKLLI